MDIQSVREARGEQGFTIVELMIVVLILGILVGIVMLSISYSRTKAHQAACKANMRTIANAIAAYQVDHPEIVFPRNLNDLTSGEEKYIKGSFNWKCPAGDTDTESGDYRENYNPETGEVTCPRRDHNL